MTVVVQVYQRSEDFPSSQRFRLTDQLQRSAVSIPSNIAEGAARQTRREFAHFLHVARGSVSELDTQLEIARRLGFLDESQWMALNKDLERVDKMLSGLIRRQRRLLRKGQGSPSPASRLSFPDPLES